MKMSLEYLVALEGEDGLRGKKRVMSKDITPKGQSENNLSFKIIIVFYYNTQK